MSKTLVVVESPGKIKKIQSILGSKYVVVASVGHILDLDPKTMSIDIDNQFKPLYKPIVLKNKVISNLKYQHKLCTDLLIATDEDREGEMIGWSIAHILGVKDPKRIVFNSITHDEILNSVKNPSKLNYNMIDAQKARRVLDRLLGYELCPLLKNQLTAGRVQSIVVKIIVDREDEISKFVDDTSYFKVNGLFTHSVNININMTCILKDVDTNKTTKFSTYDDAVNFLKLCTKSVFTVNSVNDNTRLQSAPPPFTTSTLQQEASRKLKMSAKLTMMTAQRLYEEGFITYMRTDSTNLSKDAVDQIKKYVVTNFGEQFYKGNCDKKKSKNKQNVQEAHEAIRPTDIETIQCKLGANEARLYSLIWKRAVASQMESAEFIERTVKISVSKSKHHMFETVCETVKFIGYLIVYNSSNNETDDKSKELIDIKPKTKLKCVKVTSEQQFPKPKTRFNEASLIDMLDPKNLGIGRPSTYASIISKILERGYVKIADVEGVKKLATVLEWISGTKVIEKSDKSCVIGSDKKKFVPTEIGCTVTKFLVENFPNIMEYEFTSNMEKNLDNIAEGEKDWVTVISEFYNSFHPNVVKLKQKCINGVLDKSTRILSEDPEVVALNAKYGPVVKKMVGSKWVFAPIKPPLTLETVSLEQALKILEYPKTLGKYKNINVIIKKSQYGLYLVFGKSKIKLNKDVSFESAIALIEKEKDKKDKKDKKS